MCSEGIIGYFMGSAIGMALIALLISSGFKQKRHKFIAFIIAFVIGLISVYDTEKHLGDIIPCMILSLVILFGIIGLIYLILKSAKGVNDNYIEPAQKKHQSNIKKYRKYVINCDKKGKQPLSYKQWKFAYGNTKK